MNRTELKQAAKGQIKGNMGALIAVCVICSLVSSATSVTVIGSILLTYPLQLGTVMIYVGMTYGDKPNLNKLIDGFKNGYFLKSVLAGIMVGVFTFLWSLLLFIPGIVKGVSYSMTFYIMAERPELSASECVKESRRITYGHKMELFVLGLSFIPWFLLGFVTLGLAFFYVVPYISATYANAYRHLSASKSFSF